MPSQRSTPVATSWICQRCWLTLVAMITAVSHKFSSATAHFSMAHSIVSTCFGGREPTVTALLCMLQDSVMQELNARHSASVAAKLDAMKQHQQQQHGQEQNQGHAQWAQQQGPRPLPGRSLTPGSDFWRQSQQDVQQAASQGLQEVRIAGSKASGRVVDVDDTVVTPAASPSQLPLKVCMSMFPKVCGVWTQVLVYSGHYACELPPVPGGVRQEVSVTFVPHVCWQYLVAEGVSASITSALQAYKKPASISAQHKYHITTQVSTALLAHRLLCAPISTLTPKLVASHCN
jgi:hypothetical protein